MTPLLERRPVPGAFSFHLWSKFPTLRRVVGPFLSHSGATKGSRQERRKAQRDGKRVCHSPFHDSTCRAMMVIRLPRSEHNETTLASPSFTGVEPWAERHVHGLEVALRFITRSESDNW